MKTIKIENILENISPAEYGKKDVDLAGRQPSSAAPSPNHRPLQLTEVQALKIGKICAIQSDVIKSDFRYSLPPHRPWPGKNISKQQPSGD